jgi:hypothetical protein
MMAKAKKGLAIISSQDNQLVLFISLIPFLGS